MRTVLRAAGRVAAAAVCAGALAGCTSEVTTAFTVSSPTQAQVVTGVVFTGEAADVIAGNEATLNSLVAVFTDRLGVKPDVDSADGRLQVSAHVPYADLAKVADVTGVKGAQLGVAGDQPRLRVALGPAPEVVAAVRRAAKNEPESAAVTQTMLDSTQLVVAVTFPGGVTSATSTGAVGTPAVDGDTATVRRAATATGQGSVTVSGDPTGTPWVWLGGAALLVGAGAVAYRRGRAGRRGPRW